MTGEPFDPQHHEAVAQQPVDGAQSGTIVEEVVHSFGRPPSDQQGRALTVDLVREGEPVGDLGIDTARRRVKDGLHSLPWDGLKLSKGEPAIPTLFL